ncbi:MAG: OmpH family outer membrane protein [Flavobacteriaceae bacterium]|nr:OmpH family outer membrane protein [Flavobacteriaceae bacterium]
MKNLNKLLPIVNIVLTLGILLFLAFYVTFESKKNEVVYIDNIILFNGFNMAKDMSDIHTKKIKKQTKKLDSLYQLFQMEIKSKDENNIKLSQQKVQKADEALSVMKQHFSNVVSQQIWDRLNAYIKEFGKAQGFKIILGTQGGGNVMYGDDAMDVTSSVLEYANLKYEGN